MLNSVRRFFTLLEIPEGRDYTAAGVICGLYQQGLLQDTVRQSLPTCCLPLAASRLRCLRFSFQYMYKNTLQLAARHYPSAARYLSFADCRLPLAPM